MVSVGVDSSLVGKSLAEDPLFGIQNPSFIFFFLD